MAVNSGPSVAVPASNQIEEFRYSKTIVGPDNSNTI